MPGIVLAWLTGEGLIFYRSWRQQGRFPVPGQLLAASGIFALLALVAEAPQATFAATAAAWGFDIAAFLNLAPDLTTGGTNTGKSPITGPQNAGAAPTQGA